MTGEYTFDQILTRMKGELKGEVSAMEGTFGGDILQAVAAELARIWSQEIDTVTQRGFVFSAQGEWLDQICGNYGVSRKEGESDDALRRRALDYIRQRGASGNAAHYAAWARSVEGVTAAVAVPLARGAGTVDLYIAGPEAGAELTQQVDSLIQQLRPVGADVRVIRAQPMLIQVEARVALSEGIGLSRVRQEFIEALDGSLREMPLTGTGQTVSINRIIGSLMNCQGVADGSQIRINGQSGSLTVPLGRYAALGEVTLKEADNA